MTTPDSPRNNPYIAGSPIKGQEMFFGRDDIFEKVRTHLVGEHQDNPIVIYGQRRTGKTSVLYQMGRRLNEYAREERYVAVLVDLQGFALKSMDDFLLELAYTIRRELRPAYKLQRPDKTAFKNDARQAFDDTFLPTVQSAIAERRLLLMFDEAIRLQEAVAKDKLPLEVFAYLRSLMQHEGYISFIFSLGRKIDDLLPEYTVMFNVALMLQVSFLDERAARSLVTEPVADLYAFDEEAIKHLLALTSRHAFFTQVICHTLFIRWEQQGLERITSADIDAVLEEATNLTVVNLKYVWDEATPVQKFVLAAMSDMQYYNINSLRLLHHLEQAEIYLRSNEITAALRELKQREVINSSTHPHFHVVLVRRWISREKPLTLVRDELRQHLQERFGTLTEELRPEELTSKGREHVPEDSEEPKKSLEVAYYLRLLHQSWWLILLTAVTALTIALLVSLSQVATYETHARYLISPTGDLSGIQAVYALEALKNRTIVSTYAEILNSQRIYEEVRNTLGIEREEMADYTLTALVLPEASVLEVAVKGPDAKIATRMANNVGEQAVNYLTGAYDAYEVELLDQALVPTIPVSPNPVQNGSIALILGLALGSGLVLVRGYLSSLNMSESSSLSTTSQGIYNHSEFKRNLDKILHKEQTLSLGLVQLHTTNGMAAQPTLVKELVEQIGKLLPGELRGKDIVGHWTNNSLAILMPSVSRIMAYSEFHYIQQILAESLRQSNITTPLVPYIGVVTSQEGGSSKALIRRAEQALIEAQQSGQSVVLYFHY